MSLVTVDWAPAAVASSCSPHILIISLSPSWANSGCRELYRGLQKRTLCTNCEFGKCMKSSFYINGLIRYSSWMSSYWSLKTRTSLHVCECDLQCVDQSGARIVTGWPIRGQDSDPDLGVSPLTTSITSGQRHLSDSEARLLMSCNTELQLVWLLMFRTTHSASSRPWTFFCHKRSDPAKNFVWPVGKFWDVSQLFPMGIFGDNVTFSAPGAPRKSRETYFHVKSKNN